MLAAADALLVHLRPDEVFEKVIPSKTYEYLAAGRSIVMGVSGEAARLVKEADVGMTFLSRDPDSLVGAVDKLARVLLVAGARPNFVKVAPILRALGAYPKFETKLVHTGQHYDDAMSKVSFEELGLPDPDIHLSVGPGTQARQTAKVMVTFEEVVAAQSLDLVVVVGDVNSTLACSLVASKAVVPLAHVEAGLRSHVLSMPEEVNHLVTDSLAQILFTTSYDASENLLREGHPLESIHLVGNTTIDTLSKYEAAAQKRAIRRKLGLPPGGYLLVTLHRPANVDGPEKLRAILRALAEAPLPVVFPLHPRTEKTARNAGLSNLLDKAGATRPLGYLDFLSLQMSAAVVLTDSGGVQEETTALGVACLTLRENTERPVTISHDTNRIIGVNPARILPEVQRVLKEPPSPREGPPMWDGGPGRI